jgi:hypothetical protein
MTPSDNLYKDAYLNLAEEFMLNRALLVSTEDALRRTLKRNMLLETIIKTMGICIGCLFAFAILYGWLFL